MTSIESKLLISLIIFGVIIICLFIRNKILSRMCRRYRNLYNLSNSNFDISMVANKKISKVYDQGTDIIKESLSLIHSYEKEKIDLVTFTKKELVDQLKQVYKQQHDYADSAYMELINNNDKILDQIQSSTERERFVVSKKALREHREFFNRCLGQIKFVEEYLDSIVKIHSSKEDIQI